MSSVWDKVGTKLAIVIVVLCLGLLVIWWRTVQDQRDTAAEVMKLRSQMQAMQQHVLESQRLLEALDSLKQEVRDVRAQSNTELEASCRLAGDERLDYLVRLLETDLARRGGVDAARITSGSVSGAGRGAGGAGASSRKAP